MTTPTKEKPVDTELVLRRVRRRRAEIEETKAKLDTLFAAEHRDYVVLFRAGMPKLRIAKEVGIDKQQIRKAIDRQLAEAR